MPNARISSAEAAQAAGQVEGSAGRGAGRSLRVTPGSVTEGIRAKPTGTERACRWPLIPAKVCSVLPTIPPRPVIPRCARPAGFVKCVCWSYVLIQRILLPKWNLCKARILADLRIQRSQFVRHAHLRDVRSRFITRITWAGFVICNPRGARWSETISGGISAEVRRVANVRRDFDRDRRMENCTPTSATRPSRREPAKRPIGLITVITNGALLVISRFRYSNICTSDFLGLRAGRLESAARESESSRQREETAIARTGRYY